MAAERTDLLGIVTQPDRPAGRGQKLRPSPVKAAAANLDVRVYEPPGLAKFAEELGAQQYDLFIVVSYGKILPPSLLAVPKQGALNVHPSLLPKYRGASPLQAALRDGEAQTGVTIILMDSGMDTGDVVLAERTPIAPGETYGELHDRLAKFGAQALSHAIDLARSGHIPHVPQRGDASVTRPIRRADLEIDWNRPAVRIVNAVRAYSPAPAARATLDGVPLKVLRARTGAATIANAPAGSILGSNDDAVIVRCADGTVELLEVISPNRPAQSGAAFLRSRQAAKA